VNVPTFELTVARVSVVVVPVVPEPETSPVNVKAPEIAAVPAKVTRPYVSMVKTGTAVEEP